MCDRGKLKSQNLNSFHRYSLFSFYKLCWHVSFLRWTPRKDVWKGILLCIILLPPSHFCRRKIISGLSHFFFAASIFLYSVLCRCSFWQQMKIEMNIFVQGRMKERKKSTVRNLMKQTYWSFFSFLSGRALNLFLFQFLLEI